MRAGGILKGGGASRSESNESIAGGNRTANTSALVREQTAVSAPLRLLLIDFLAEARKPPPEAPSRNADRAIVYSLTNYRKNADQRHKTLPLTRIFHFTSFKYCVMQYSV